MLCAEAVEALHQQVRAKEQRAAVDLKHHIDAAQAALADKAEIHQTRAKQQAETHAKSFNALLESGQNPYAVRFPANAQCPGRHVFENMRLNTAVHSMMLNVTFEPAVGCLAEPRTTLESWLTANR